MTASEYENLLIDRQPPVAIVTINRPRVLNALSFATLNELDRALQTLGAGSDIRAIVLTGSGGKSFVSGADISELQGLESAEQACEQARHAHEIIGRIQRMAQPVIAAVNGYALGGGCELAMACDIIIAAENAQFGQPEVNLGIIPGYGGTQRLPRLVGRAKALELILTGERIRADEALRIGLVNKVVPQEELLDAAIAMGKTIAEKGPIAVALAKRAVYEGLEVGLTTGNKIETAYFGLAAGTEDRKEGTSAFLEKRKPEWRGA
jgi:enoyl-CoA hydratase